VKANSEKQLTGSRMQSQSVPFVSICASEQISSKISPNGCNREKHQPARAPPPDFVAAACFCRKNTGVNNSTITPSDLIASKCGNLTTFSKGASSSRDAGPEIIDILRRLVAIRAVEILGAEKVALLGTRPTP
jgi:hypothetical protein